MAAIAMQRLLLAELGRRRVTQNDPSRTFPMSASRQVLSLF